jgi:hypothetical protein
MTTRYALDHGYDVILEGIMHAERYANVLRALASDHRGTTVFYYFAVSFAESVRRHATRPQSREFGVDALRGWYRDRDLLSFANERIVNEESCLGGHCRSCPVRSGRVSSGSSSACRRRAWNGLLVTEGA